LHVHHTLSLSRTLYTTQAIKELEAKLGELKKASDWENMTFESEMASNPKIKQEIAKELEQHKWFTV
jgi:hypothetical protein